MRPRVAYLGPPGTFCEQALLTQDDLADADLVAVDTIRGVLEAVQGGDVELGFVPIENAIEGSVTVTVDALAFHLDLLIQREVVIDIQMCLLGLPGTGLDAVTEVMSIPVASAQCQEFVRAKLPGARVTAANSTAEAARLVAEGGDRARTAIGPELAGRLYGLEPVAVDIEDVVGNQTRFVLVARDGVPDATGNDRTSIVVFQRANVPGSLLDILQQFATHHLNLSKLESRPTKQGLGDYCFLIDVEGHISDDAVADCLWTLKVKQSDVKYLGSYPKAGGVARKVSLPAEKEADAWLADVRAGRPHRPAGPGTVEEPK